MNPDFTISLEARKRYLDRRQKDFETLQHSLAARDLTNFMRIGHQLKGNAASFGYLDLEVLAVQMEEAGLRRDLSAAEKVLARFHDWIHRTSFN